MVSPAPIPPDSPFARNPDALPTLTRVWKDFVLLLRIAKEFIHGFAFFSRVYPMVSIFGSARIPATNAAYTATRELASRLGREGFAILTGGGPSFMEAANRGARDVGARSLACNIILTHEQSANPYVDRLATMRFFFTRKYMLISYSMALICLPGGYGTLDELFEVLTLMQTGKIPKRPVFLIGKEYWGGLEAWLRDTVLKAGAIGPESLPLFKITDDLDEVVEALKRAKHEIDDERKGNPVKRETQKANAL
jgi:uncharacterized protein (TIGR00730 family)